MYKELNIATQFVSEDSNFRLSKHSVVDKSVAGCGLTTFVLGCSENVILAEPKVALVDNKLNQEIPGQLLLDYRKIKSVTQGVHKAKPGHCKIITCFDSIYKFEQYLQEGWWLVIDEFQDLFTMFQLKSQTYTSLQSLLQKYLNQITFISATPIPEEYEPDWMKDLDHYKLRFQETLKVRPILMKSSDPVKRFQTDILKPILETGKTSVGGSTFGKCIVFCNSLRAVVRMSRSLPQSRYAVLCSSSPEKDKYLKKYNMRRFIQTGYSVGNLPDFLFVTSVGFEGLDLYSKEHMNVVVSYPTAKYITGEIRESYNLFSAEIDLPQIIARNRTQDNPHRSRYVFLYNESIQDGSGDRVLEDITKAREALDGLVDRCDKINEQVAKGQIVNINLFVRDKEGKLTPNYMEINHLEYVIKNLIKRYDSGGIELSAKPSDPILVPEITWESVRAKYIRIFVKKPAELTFSEIALVRSTRTPWTAEEKRTEYYQIAKQCFLHDKKIPVSFEKAKADATRKFRSTRSNQVASVLKTRLSVGKTYLKSDLKATLYDVYNFLGIKEKAYCTTINLYAKNHETTEITDSGRAVRVVKLDEWL